MNIRDIPECWRNVLNNEWSQPYMNQLAQFVAEEREQYAVFPDESDVFAALRMTPYHEVKVLILGQDPYHDDGQAHGLSFSVREGVRIPPSLRNIFAELQDDLGIRPPTHGNLQRWAEQGVLLLNTVLTVRAHQPNSHRNHGWEQLTDAVIRHVSERPHVAFVLWGRPAQSKARLTDSRHLVLQSAHPSPLSARRGFFGSRPFSAVNEYLTRNGSKPIDWNCQS